VKFICDDNLGRLARYLRMLGMDTCFDDDIDDASLLKTAGAEHRFLLTRDRKLKSKSIPHGILILEDDDPLKQLSTVVGRLDLAIDTASIFSRCSRCNTPCEDINRESLSGRIFPYILKTQERIKHCPSCGRYYWKGSHYKALLKKLKNTINAKYLVGEWPDT
jgi:uncharacterized protein with PIN domain